MRDDRPPIPSRRRALSYALVILAILAGGAILTACGGDNSTSATEEAKEEVENGVNKAEEGIEEGKTEAEKGVEKAKKKAEELLE
jgi:hypothetical protein